MGCTQSKIENEETVTRCKERRRFMKEAVGARNQFAAAHSAYAMSLKNTGAALSDYAQGEVQYSSVSSSAAAAVSSSSAGIGLPQPPYEPIPPPPPPLPYTQSPLQRANTAPEMTFPKTDMKHSEPIMEEENEEDDAESVHGLRHRTSKSSGGGGGLYRQGVLDDEVLQKPPSPPRTPPQSDSTPPPPPPPDSKGMPGWDYFFPPMENVPGPSLAEVDETRIKREEIERKIMEEREQKREVHAGDGGRKSTGKMEADEVVEKEPELPPQPPQPAKTMKKVKQVVPAEGKRKGGSNVNLLQIFGELDDCFLKASESAHDVSKMLEANRLHYHSNFADTRGIGLSESCL